MKKRIFLAVTLVLISLTGEPLRAASGSSLAEIEQRIKDHLNERMYNSCRAVVLTSRTNNEYQGYAEFLNGIRSRLTVRVSDGDIEYAFVEPAPVTTDSEPPEATSEESPWAMLDEMEALARRQAVELARLRQLCRQAGIDPTPPPGATAPEAVEGEPELPMAEEDTAADANAVPVPGDAPIFTSEMYARIQKGMSYAQVGEILGADGDPLSSSYFDGAANEIFVWTNPDDSHICVVFQDGKVLVKTQFGLPGIAPVPTPQEDANQATEIERFESWLLAREHDGQIISTGYSLGDWLENVHRVLQTKPSEPPAAIDVVEQENQILVRLTRQDGNGAGQNVCFYLAFRRPEADKTDPSADDPTERVLIPTRMTVNDQGTDNPIRTWRAMVRLAELPIEAEDRLQQQ